MDLHTVSAYRTATGPDHLTLGPGERFLGGGTWLFSEPQDDITGLVDLSGMDWPAWEITPDGGLRVGATCTIAELARIPSRPEWRAHPLFAQCTQALLASFKVWNSATVGGNICRSYAAAAIVSLCAALDGVAEIWAVDGTRRSVPVADIPTGNGTNALAVGDLLRAVELPAATLAARTGFRKIALNAIGRSGAVLTGRVDPDGAAVFTVTAATSRPAVLRYARLPTAGELHADAAAVTTYYTDPLGVADWRRQVSVVLLEEIRQELAA